LLLYSLYKASIPIKPRAPARPALIIWVGIAAPPLDEEEDAVPEAEAADSVLEASADEVAAAEEVVELWNLPVTVVLLKPVVIGAALPAAVRK